MSVTVIDANNFEAEVLKSQKTVLLDFYADWCGPCKMLAPIIHEIAEEQADIKVCKVNVDEQPSLATAFEVMSIPTLFVIKNGRVTEQSLGVKTKAQILEMLK